MQRLDLAVPGSVAQLTEDPLEALGSWAGLQLVITAERDVGGGCSVSGTYDYESARLVVGRAASRGRQFFTALHELGHHLQQHDEESVKLLEREPDGGFALEDDICDAFAAEVLLPEDAVSKVLAPKGPTALTLVDLIYETNASKEACCVRAVQRLLGQGYVMLCDPDGIAIFTATNTPYPVRRNTPQHGNKVIESAIRWGSGRCESRVRFPSGWWSPLFYADSQVDDAYIIAVYAEHLPPWASGLTYAIAEPNRPVPPDATP